MEVSMEKSSLNAGRMGLMGNGDWEDLPSWDDHPHWILDFDNFSGKFMAEIQERASIIFPNIS